MDHNPNGVASPCISHRTKPRWGLIGSAWLTQGSCATLGGRTKSLRDFSAAPLRHGVFALILLFWQSARNPVREHSRTRLSCSKPRREHPPWAAALVYLMVAGCRA